MMCPEPAFARDAVYLKVRYLRTIEGPKMRLKQSSLRNRRETPESLLALD
jgi:hypothetical protein